MSERNEQIKTELQLSFLRALGKTARTNPGDAIAALSSFSTPTDQLVALELLNVLPPIVLVNTELPIRFVRDLLVAASDMVVYSALNVAKQIASVEPGRVWPIAREHLTSRTAEEMLHLNDHPWGQLFPLIETIVTQDPATFIPKVIDLQVELNKRLMKPEVAADPLKAARFDWPTVMITGWNAQSSIHEDDLVWLGITAPLMRYADDQPKEAFEFARTLLQREEPFARRAAIWVIARLAQADVEEAKDVLADYLRFETSNSWHIWTTAHAQLVGLIELDPEWVLSQLEARSRDGDPVSEFDIGALSKLLAESSRARDLSMALASQDVTVCKALLSQMALFVEAVPEFAAEVFRLALDRLDPTDEDLIFATRGIVERIGLNDFSLAEPLFQLMIDTPNLSRRALLADELVSVALSHPDALPKVEAWLTQLAHDDDPHVRESVAHPVAKLRELDSNFALRTLRMLASDQDPALDLLEDESSRILVRTVRGHAASALPSLAEAHPDESSALLFTLARDPVDIVRWLALHSLRAFANWAGAQARLQELLDPSKTSSPLNDAQATLRLVALNIAWHPAVHDLTFASSLISTLERYIAVGGEVAHQAIHVAVGLEQLHREARFTSLVERTMNSPDVVTRRWVAQALRGNAEFLYEYSRLSSLSMDPDPGVREEVALCWSHRYSEHPNEVHALVLLALDALERFGFGNPNDRFWALLLYLISQALKTFIHEHIDWTVNALNRASSISDAPVLNELLRVAEELPDAYRASLRPFLESCINEGISSAALLLRPADSHQP